MKCFCGATMRRVTTLMEAVAKDSKVERQKCPRCKSTATLELTDAGRLGKVTWIYAGWQEQEGKEA